VNSNNLMTGVLLLAAGKGRRFGSDKRWATLADGRSVFAATLDVVASGGLPVLVCLRPGDIRAQQLLDERGLAWVECDRAEEGMGAVLAQGLQVVSEWQAVLVALADMPWITPQTFRAVAEVIHCNSICRASYSGVPGHPVGFGSDYFNELRQLSGDEGARSLLQRHSALVTDLPVDDPGILQDIDRPEDIPVE
jgi:molybdenum cofactor cytidylyltransferase